MEIKCFEFYKSKFHHVPLIPRSVMLRKKTAWRATLSLILSQVNRCVVIATNGERRTEPISSRRVGTMNAMDIAAHLIAELVRLDLEMGDGC